jgi:chromate transporter
VSFPEAVLVFLKAALLSSGGLQSLPILQDELIVQRELLTYGDFATAVAIGRITPGPNGLFVLSIGYYVGGLAGALAAAVGVILPPFLAIGLVRLHRRLAGRPWLVGATRGITAAAVGLLIALGYSFTAPLLGSPASLAILGASLVLLVALRLDALPVLAAGGLAGLALTAAGVPLA